MIINLYMSSYNLRPSCVGSIHSFGTWEYLELNKEVINNWNNAHLRFNAIAVFVMRLGSMDFFPTTSDHLNETSWFQCK